MVLFLVLAALLFLAARHLVPQSLTLMVLQALSMEAAQAGLMPLILILNAQARQARLVLSLLSIDGVLT
jgi:hypothetical protein